LARWQMSRLASDHTASPVIFELGQRGRANRYVDAGAPLTDFLPREVLREDLPLPDNSELDVVRHYTRLSQRTFGIDVGFYPLGSCTMKYNPRVNDAMASLPALLIAKAYFKDRGETQRDKVIVPDTAHGTNPASAAMCGFKVISLRSDERGRVGVGALEEVLGDDTAVCMMTNPNTLGLFEDHIAEIARAVHRAGGLMYYDGANANALMGNARPGDMGFDLIHLNTHKTFTIPHGGGGAGHGPLGVAAHLVDYLPTPVVVAEAKDGAGGWSPSDRLSYHLEFDRPKSIGPMRSFWSNFAHAVRALAYLYANGEEGLRRVSQLAVLNANYLRVKIAEFLETPYPELCRHEFVVSAQQLKRDTGVRALDLAKALLDRGFMAPTMYFPLIVPECLMIEPTETESKETLDAFVEALREIVKTAKSGPESLFAAPVTTVVGRLDETRAARQPDLRWRPSPN